eukprot:gene940-1822_t
MLSSVIIGTVPVLLNYGLDLSEVDSADGQIPLQKSISSLEHKFSMVASIACFFPIVLELIVDSFQVSKNRRSILSFFALWSLVLAILMPNALILLDMNGFVERYYYYYPLISNFRGIVAALSFLSVMSEYGAPIWTSRNTGFAVLSFVIAVDIGSIQAFSISVKFLSIVQNIFYSLATCIILWLTFLWIRYLSNRPRPINFTFQEYCCNLHLLGLYLAFGGFWSLRTFFFSASTWANVDPLFLAGGNYLLIFAAVIVVVFEGRITRTKLILEQIVSDVEQSVEMAVDILNNFLTYESLSGNVLELCTEILNVKKFLEDSMRPFVLLAREKEVQLILDMDFGPNLDASRLLMKADRNKLIQVLRTLVTNAIKYSESGKVVTIRVRTTHTTTTGSAINSSSTIITRANIGVSLSTVSNNNGSFESAGLLSHKENTTGSNRGVFGFRIRRGSIMTENMCTNEDIPNTLHIEVIDCGQGISKVNQNLSHGIITLHEGRLSLYSKGVGHGCTFTIDLPLYTSTTSSKSTNSTNINNINNNDGDANTEGCLREELEQRESSCDGKVTEITSNTPAFQRLSIVQMPTEMWSRYAKVRDVDAYRYEGNSLKRIQNDNDNNNEIGNENAI